MKDTVAPMEAHTVNQADDARALFAVDDDVDSSPVLDVSIVLDALAQSHGDDTLVLPGTAAPVSRDAAISVFTSAFTSAVTDYATDKKASDSITAPLTQITSVVKTIKKATDTTKAVKSRAGFDAEGLRAKIASAHRGLDALEAELPAPPAPPAPHA